MALSDSVQSELEHYAGANPELKENARTKMTKILLDTYGSTDHINQKYFLDADKHIMDAQVFSQLGRSVEQFASQFPESKDRFYWGGIEGSNGQRNIVMLRNIYFKANNRLAGSLFLGIRSSYFSSAFEDVDLGRDSMIYIFDLKGGDYIVKTPWESKISSNRVATALVQTINKSILQGQKTGFITPDDNDQNKQIVVAFSQIPQTSWVVVSEIPYANLVIEARVVRDEIVVIAFICFMCAVAFAYIISRSISSPLKELTDGMRETKAGNFSINITSDGNDELTVMSQGFNDMATKIGLDREKLEDRVVERTLKLEIANQRLSELSMTDSMTGIPNRRRFDEVFLLEMRRAERAGKMLGLIMIDVDFFKNYNDNYGHQEGDECLRQVALLLKLNASRAGDLAARYGGEEFVVLIAETDLVNVMTQAEHIRQSQESLNLAHVQSPLGRVTLSVGVVVLVPNEMQTPEMIIRMADKAMYQAKMEGRNKVVLYGKNKTLA